MNQFDEDENLICPKCYTLSIENGICRYCGKVVRYTYYEENLDSWDGDDEDAYGE